MNQGIYKLVYSKVLNMFVPASEAARSHGAKNSKRIRKQAKNLLCFVLIGSFVFTGSTYADPAGLIPGTQAWVNASITGATSNSMTITQTAPKAILDWQKLNLSPGELLQFNQQGQRTWSALNRIHDLDPSILDGSVLADGNVYFINTNGIIFGANAKFNVGSLYAGTLDITDKLFNDGFINSDGITSTKVFEGSGGSVIVQQGALINTASGGKVLLFAPAVENSGIINTPDGQTILAAGKTVYLASSKDPAGFLVEVDGGTSATNLGKIVAERGNITMMGLAVNQQGTLTATTSVRANGSIRLLARGSNSIVTLAAVSVTEVNPEYANKEETIASQPFNTSKVRIEAASANIDGLISAKGGDVNVATSDRIFLGGNATIDVSGVDAIAPMSRNQLEIQLFSDQLKDAPILRDGGLFKQTVYVDARKGTQLFDVQPYLDLKGATVAEKMTKAGTVTLTAANDMIAQKGSVINMSGGSTTFEAGAIKETNLYYNGKLVPISEAKPGIPYDTTADIYTIKDTKWGVTRGWDLVGGSTQDWGGVVTTGANGQLITAIVGTQIAGYFEGDNAGTLTIAHPQEGAYIQHLALAGTLLANTKTSIQQLTNQTIPLGGKLVANANDLVIAKIANDVTTSFTENLANDFQSSVSTDFLAQGFNRVDLSNVKSLTVNDAMNLKPNGELALGSSDGTTQLNANIIAPGANVSLASALTNVADNVKISSAGTFTNDKTGVAGQFSNPAAINGGSITANALNLGKSVTLDASAGAWVDNKGKLHQGKAGDISFSTASKLDDSVNLQSYGFTKGGALTIDFSGQSLNIAGNSNASLTDIDVSKDFFNKGGFSKYSLTGLDVNVGDSAAAPQEIYASAQTWQMNAGFVNQTGGQAMSVVATPAAQPDITRKPVSLSFSADKFEGVLTLAENTTLRTDRGGSVSLAAGKRVNVLGDIVVPSGGINIKLNDTDVSGNLPYDPTQAIYIGEKSTLTATGSSLALADSQPSLLKTQVFNAGNITIDAPKGALIVKEGAILDVSGTSVVNDTKTLAGYVRETLNADAGTIKLSASDGLLLDGTFKGLATGSARGGTLDVGFTSTVLNGSSPLLTGNREFTLTQQKLLLAQNFTMGDTLKTSTGDVFTATSTDAITGQISADQVQQGGFANLKVKSYTGGASGANDSLQLADGLDLKLSGNLQLLTPRIDVQNDGAAKLNASSIVLKSPNNSVDNSTVTAGNGKLDIHSKQLYIQGFTAVAGVKETSVNTTLDITGANGGIVANGDINLSARQIYPSANLPLAFEAIGTDSKITVKSSGVAAKPVYSAGGVLKLTAENVVQSGVLSAPFGQIIIDATKSVTLSAGSTTSVSANGLIIPNGTTITGGEKWVGEPPIDKSITIKSASVDLQKNAVIDLSAGGDMFASEWVPGIGGTANVLSAIGADGNLKPNYNTYAVIPTLGQDYAPIDNGEQQVGIGQSVYLTGVPGLASGQYTLLPASYALVPGAFMVEANIVGSSLLPTQIAPQLDGSTLTTGYLADIGTGARDVNWSTFRVTDGAIFRPATGAISKAPSQYILTSATKYFSNPLKTNGQDVSLPIDVARLSLDASKLTLDSTIVANKQAGGSGLQVDLSSQNIRVVNSVGADDGSLQLTVASVNALNADSLLLGGSRKLQDGIVNIATTANSVTIENDSAHAVIMPELITAAIGNVTVKTGALVDTGVASKTPTKTTLKADGDGALLALSSASDINYSRTGGSATSTQGALNIEAGSTLKAGNSVVLDATKLASLNGSVTLQDGGSATFGANRILLGSAPLNTLGLNVNAGALAALGQLKALTLNSYNNIDTFGSVNFGNSNLDLTLNAAGIAGHLADGELSVPANAAPSVITANSFTLKNTQGVTYTPPLDSSGRGLEINANTVKLDGGKTVSGKTEIAGYTKLDIKADEIRAANIGETNFNVAETKLTTGRVTADTGAEYKIKSNAKLEIVELANAKLSTQTGLGAKLDLAATDLKVASNIDLSSGKLALTAINDLNIANGANIRATSTANVFYNKVVNANAGSVVLTSSNGNVNVDAGAVVDVTSLGEANAGQVKVVAANGTANITGDLKGTAIGAGKGGVLDVDVKTLADLTATNSKAAGFGEGRQYRVRSGDVNITGTVANGNELAAREAIVSADAGKITVTGDIVATAPKNSRISIFAGNGVTFENTANLKANSTKAGAVGGKVEVYTAAGNLDLKAGSSLDVSAGVGGTGGKVAFRAPRTGAGAGDGVAVTNFATNVVGAKSAVLEVFKTFLGVTSVTTGNGVGATLGFNTVANDVNSFMGSKDAIVAGLGKTGDATFHLRAGTEIQSASSLTIDSDWNLYSATRTGGEPSVLTLRAKDNITFNGSLSDGFTTATSTGVIGEGDSSSYRVVAGADFTAANLLATNASTTAGNITLNNGTVTNMRVIRTGTGDIDIAAGGNLIMGGVNAAIYTAGRSAAALEGFDSPANILKPLYLANGGDISINAKSNIVGAEPATGRQLINQWLFRQGGGSGNFDTTWWVRPELFRQSLATLGGGDINMNAGGNISNFSASAPTTARFDTNGTTGNQSIDGGGDVKVKAGGDINNGVYFVAKGEGDIEAGGSIQKQGNTFGTTLALQDGSFNVNVGRNAYIETTINPTLVSQSTANAGSLNTTGINSYFNSYSTQALVNVASLAGNVEYGTGTTDSIFSKVVGFDPQVKESVKYNPSSLNVVTHNGDAAIGDITLLPSPVGNLKVLAANNVNLGNITLSDADPAVLPSISKPLSVFNKYTTAISRQLNGHASQLLHKNDAEPVSIVAQTGNIAGIQGTKVTLPKAAQFVAGKDINALKLEGQNNNASDITILKAGQDIKVDDIAIAGPGELLVQAGRNIDLTAPETLADIITVGNVNNPALPKDGSSITLQAGLGKGANVQGYIDQYILPTGTGPTTITGNTLKLAEYRAATAAAVTEYMRKTTGNNALTDEEAITQFNVLSLEAKTIFANRHLTSELIASARDFAKAGNHNRGNSAIAALFPTLNQGDILLYASKVSTNSGGSIDMLAPGGLINVGSPGKRFKGDAPSSGDIGVITEKGGAIRAIADGDFQVNQSKVITQYGSDIAVWSTKGTIDAGRGSKTATSIPERIVQTDADGNTIVEVRGVASGSGIRAQTYDEDGPNGPKKAPSKGNVYLTAPIVDAGEAGIEAGDLFIVAPIVLNATNIQVSGASSGVPVAATSSLAGVSAGLSPDAVNSATAAVAQSVAQSASQSFVKPELPSIISVDVISIGK